MRTARSGDTVKVHYTGRLDDGTVFDSSREHDPLTFTIGEGSLIRGFEDAVVGMSVGEAKTETVPSGMAYGDEAPELFMNVARGDFPPDVEPVVGQMLEIRKPDGRRIPVIVNDVTEEEVTLNANHPLAGKDLTFEIQLVEIV
jgi:peptidylprolyl isomerase